uniref:G_PROTEIN_RECEP_F1_2 domain-containing protein n=1 Tax=Panagrellus redivivus TaxID=6233 RepID=A0A7E4ZTI8_PANRE
MFNFFAIGVFMVIVGFLGLRYNSFVISVYSSPSHRRNSTAIFLCALACSDFCLICTTMFISSLESWSYLGFKTLAYVYAMGTPLVLQLSAALESICVYICIAAAINCLVAKPCTPKRAKAIVIVITCVCFIFTIHKFPLLKTVQNLDEYSLPSLIVSNLRSGLAIKLYDNIILTLLRGIIPFVLFTILGTCLIATKLRKRFRGRQPVPTTDDNCEQLDTEAYHTKDYIVSVIIVVLFFDLLHFTVFLNYFDRIKSWYVIDLSYLFITINCTIKFFIYLNFGKSFRLTLNEIRS